MKALLAHTTGRVSAMLSQGALPNVQQLSQRDSLLLRGIHITSCVDEFTIGTISQ